MSCDWEIIAMQDLYDENGVGFPVQMERCPYTLKMRYEDDCNLWDDGPSLSNFKNMMLESEHLRTNTNWSILIWCEKQVANGYKLEWYWG